jgi:hypothetical protein
MLRVIIEDRSQLRPGESAQVDMAVDLSRRVLQAPFMGRSVALSLA